jgi:hypothetical protein
LVAHTGFEIFDASEVNGWLVSTLAVYRNHSMCPT